MRYLITGGSASGKSTYAEDLALRCPGPRTYLAAMRPVGPEDYARIARHRNLRAEKGFVTVERYTDVGGVILPERGTVLLECLCNLTANEMFDMSRSCDAAADAYDDVLNNYPEDVDAYAVKQVLDGICALSAKCDTLIVVTNDVGSDGGGYGEATMAYVRTLGYLNARLACLFDRVAELTCGVPLPLKGALL